MQLYSQQKRREKSSNDKKINQAERLYYLEQNFVSIMKVNQSKADYNALHDIHAFQYFANKSVQKHLKRLSKVPLIQNSSQVIKTIPQTHENKKLKKQIDHIVEEKSIKNTSIQAVNTIHQRNHSEIQVQPSIQIQNIHQTNLSVRQKKEIQLSKLLDPYAAPVNQPILQKKKKILRNLQSYKKPSNSNPAKQFLPKIQKQSHLNLQERQLSKKFLDRLKVGIKIHENQEKKNDKISNNNENQHEKLLNLINKKIRQAKVSTQSLKQDGLINIEAVVQGK